MKIVVEIKRGDLVPSGAKYLKDIEKFNANKATTTTYDVWEVDNEEWEDFNKALACGPFNKFGL